MAKKDEKKTNAKTKAPESPSMQVLAQYIRDLSFENIAAQSGIQPEEQPEVSVQVNLDAQKLADDVFEVAQKIVVRSHVKEQNIFLLELEYAGRFSVQNVPEDQLHPYLLIECPRMIFPFVRRIISDITRDGGYPPLNVDNIDYLAMYRNEIERRAATAAKEDKPN